MLNPSAAQFLFYHRVVNIDTALLLTLVPFVATRFQLCLLADCSAEERYKWLIICFIYLAVINSTRKRCHLLPAICKMCVCSAFGIASLKKN